MNYIHNNKILLTEETRKYNNHTWSGNEVYQLDAIEFFYSQIKNENDFCVIDIGAQSGSYTLLSKFCEKTIWYAFEPDPYSYKCLVDNLKINDIKNVIPMKMGISDFSGTKVFNICKTHSGLNTLGENVTRFNPEDTEKIEIETKTLDELFIDKKINLIKIDTEGCEYNVLYGAKEVIKKYKPKIFLEYYDFNLRQFNKSIGDLNQLINDLNYKITWNKDDNVLIESK